LSRNDSPTERQEQRSFLDWLEAKGILFCGFPNNLWTSSWAQKAEQKFLGLQSGFPDLICLVPCRDGLTRLVFVEMKRVKGGTLRDDQKAWLAALQGCEEVEAACCKGAAEAIALIEAVMAVDKRTPV